MLQSPSQEEKNDVLDYWSRIEFFSPFILDNALQLNGCQKFIPEEQDNATLPWLETPEKDNQDPFVPEITGYNLYLGLFSIKDASEQARHILASQQIKGQPIDWQLHPPAGTTSCFAKLPINELGTPHWSKLALSTMPWAIGQLLNEKGDSITISEYSKAIKELIIDLRKYYEPSLSERHVENSDISYRCINQNALHSLTIRLFDWAGYTPQGFPLAIIEPLYFEKTGQSEQLVKKCNIQILNSFYLDDLAAAEFSHDDSESTPLDLYLSGQINPRVSLESAEGTQALTDALRPSRLPMGRWPSPIAHRQSLMQQFAINESIHSLQVGGVFSVNGPPGTGKTTLLNEIIADNMVRRARALSRFKSSRQAFINRCSLNFDGEKAVTVSEIHPSLLGHEMLVVSSNNTAVQNISHELPLLSDIAPNQVHLSYLETVANKMYKEEAWGLISAALGNTANCRKLVERIFITKSSNVKEERIWDWIDSYDGLTFADAKALFQDIEARQCRIVNELEELTAIHSKIHGLTKEGYCHEIIHDLRATKIKYSEKKANLDTLKRDLEELATRLVLLEQRTTLWNQQRPNILHRLFYRKTWKPWLSKSKQYNTERVATLNEMLELDARQKNTEKHLKQLESDLAVKENRYSARLREFEKLRKRQSTLRRGHSNLRLPDSKQEFTSEEAQRHSYYQSDELNQARSDLFVASMTLHEAWLAETLQPKGGFRGNLMAISKLLQGKSPTTDDDTLLAWQSVFLFIPVISSTFASVGRLFHNLGPNSIGWVLIDEAGQATPQAAVGAIWRAQRVLSIGDPFQIEPICAVPCEIVDGIAKKWFQDRFLDWAPSRISVQNLMDAATDFGITRDIGEESYWLGAPLRVHRRCMEPMFSISNQIAYSESMLPATNDTSLSLPESCWYNIEGEADDRQYVPLQGAELLHKLTETIRELDTPDIYIISPFRAVVRNLKTELMQNSALKFLFREKYPEISFSNWVHRSFGTVHAFQGKQASVVYLVLGGDELTRGAMQWAANKPNLLNVAVTRARHRFYIIGDHKCWSPLPFFSVAAKQLPTIYSQQRENSASMKDAGHPSLSPS